MDVGAWLAGLDLTRYAESFAANDIDEAVLRDLTDADLKDLGVASLGHRKRILAAIAALDAAPEPAAAAAPAPEGERRPVTVMFADLSGFTRLSGALDAEDVHALLDRFFAAVDGAVQSHGGTVDKHVGDCTMALFGAPVAYGDDPLRAVRAALAVREAVRGLAGEAGRAVGVHIGLASGEVVASPTGSDVHRAYTVTGDSVNLAARLTDRAEEDEILLAPSVHRAVAARVAAEPAGPLMLEGIAEPVQAWRLQRLAGAGAHGAFVGRRAELGQFQAALATCRDRGTGGTLLVRGEAGIGKTRLVEEFRRLAEEAGFACHTGLVLDFGAGAGRDAVRALVRSLLGLPLAADETARRGAAAAALAESRIEPAQEVHLNDLLDLPQPPHLRTLIDAMAQEARTRGRAETAAELVARAARAAPLLLVIEDAHWADAATLDAAARLAAVTDAAPALLVVTTRIEGDPLDAAWRARAGAAPVFTLDLTRLSEADARAMAEAVGGAPQVIERCLARAEGNPLFLEQLLRNADEAATVPGTVQSVILARVDRLNAADRRALQAAAVLGQRFDAAAVRHMLGEPGYDCERLVRHMLVRPQGDGSYLFAHALIRDGVYASLLRARAHGLHRSAAEWFETRDPVLHAEHLALAGDPRAARAFLVAAEAERAAYRSDAALALIESGRARAAEAADRVSLACAEGEVLLDLGRAEPALAAFAAAAESAATAEETAQALYGRAAALRLGDRIDEALALLAEAEAAARQAGRIDLTARIHHLRGNLFFPRGRILDCLAEHRAALAAAEAAGRPELVALALGGLADAEYANNRPQSSYEHFRACVSLAAEHGLGRIEVANRSMVVITQCCCGPIAGAYEEAVATIEAAQRVGHARAEIIGQHAAAFARYFAGDYEAALVHVEAAVALTERLQAHRFDPENLIFRADIRRRMGLRAEAIDLAERAWAACERTGLAYVGPMVLGMLAAATDDPGRRRWALERGAALLEGGSLLHNHLFFRIAAIDAALDGGAWDEAEHHAAALEAVFEHESSPLIRFLVARARALAAAGRGAEGDGAALARLAEEGRALGYLIFVEALARAAARSR